MAKKDETPVTGDAPVEKTTGKYVIGEFVTNLGKRTFRVGGKLYKADALTTSHLAELAANPKFKHINVK